MSAWGVSAQGVPALGVSAGECPSRGCLPRGCLHRGVSGQRECLPGGCLPGGCLSRGCLLRGGIFLVGVSAWELNWQTGVQTLPCPNLSLLTWQYVRVACFAHVRRIHGRCYGVGFCIVAAQTLPLLVQSVPVLQVILHVRLQVDIFTFN